MKSKIQLKEKICEMLLAAEKNESVSLEIIRIMKKSKILSQSYNEASKFQLNSRLGNNAPMIYRLSLI